MKLLWIIYFGVFSFIGVAVAAKPGRDLPTVNSFKGNPGCYVACYSHDSKLGVYTVAENIYFIGQVRVPGEYQGRICVPKGSETVDISTEDGFKALCQKSFRKACKKMQCWAVGDAGGQFIDPAE